MFYPKVFPFLLILAIEMPFALAQTNPVKLATQARFDLSSANVPLEKPEVLAGSGKVERMNWVAPEAKNRGYTANFAVSHYAWGEVKVRFLPQADGVVQLKLMGPREEAAKDLLYREEVLWDKIEVPGSGSIRAGCPWASWIACMTAAFAFSGCWRDIHIDSSTRHQSGSCSNSFIFLASTISLWA